MMTVKDLFENEELMHNIVEDLTDVPEDAKVIYAVWVLGYDNDQELTEAEYLIREFSDPDEAVQFAKNFTFDKFDAEYEKPTRQTTYLTIEVETVVEDPDDECGGTMNIGTVYSREFWSSEPAADYDEPIVAIATGDYELLDDGTLKLSAKFMKGFNKNDMFRAQFIDEQGIALLPYKIVSKVIYEDGDYYHCELMI